MQAPAVIETTQTESTLAPSTARPTPIRVGQVFLEDASCRCEQRDQLSRTGGDGSRAAQLAAQGAPLIALEERDRCRLPAGDERLEAVVPTSAQPREQRDGDPGTAQGRLPRRRLEHSDGGADREELGTPGPRAGLKGGADDDRAAFNEHPFPLRRRGPAGVSRVGTGSGLDGLGHGPSLRSATGNSPGRATRFGVLTPLSAPTGPGVRGAR